MIHIWRPLWAGGVGWGGGGQQGKNEMLLDVGMWGVSECSERPIYIFYIKENWILTMTRHHAYNILLTRNLHFDSDVRQWSHTLMILLNCLWVKSNYGTRGQFEYDTTLFLFWFCSFTCTMRLLFHSLFTFSRCAYKTSWSQNEC